MVSIPEINLDSVAARGGVANNLPAFSPSLKEMLLGKEQLLFSSGGQVFDALVPGLGHPS